MPTRRQFLGNATPTTTTGVLNIGTATVTISIVAGWPSGATPFDIAIEPDILANVEKILVTRSGSILTVVTRGRDGTTEKNHASGVNIYPVATALDFDEANELTSKTQTGTGSLVFGTAPNITAPTGIVKGDVGLGSVDNTTDVGKPVSTAQQTALNLKMNRYSVTIGDAVAQSFVVTHSLNTRDIQVAIYEAVTPFNLILTDVSYTTVNTVTITFSVAPTANQYRVVIMG